MSSIAVAAGKAWYTVPSFLRFFTSGTAGNVVLYGIDNAMLRSGVIDKLTSLKRAPQFFRDNKANVSFFLSYAIQIVPQHFLHALLCFGLESINTREKYIRTLIGTYTTLFGAMVGSTFMNGLLLKWGVSKDIAFWTTMYGFALINFFILRLVSLGKEGANAGDGPNVSSSASKVGRGGGGESVCIGIACDERNNLDSGVVNTIVGGVLIMLQSHRSGNVALTEFIESTAPRARF
mmetsp:Transcript_12553/g.15779  ORF Transcript_12553/g.15779 Transcript_12553/m.15779 type:complete len:235 (-) Transcript_12553:110-814(-)|eukprot:CAMPEP_0172509790 /NCGR_PEP_ID=MMETSP1066-20121228/223180_1 /TAXON_ID=671091 /ORGANISM="Coscinodiscus wailesii, Strain CCMP2513" /LENGTH=234 /DNA_ID=CAMNT_0013288451 /DNA_START=61 /DNA_END=765 /DNA_ORIENTATION=+